MCREACWCATSTTTAVGRTPRQPQRVAITTNPFDHPDAQRRFRIVNDVEELRRALDFPWDRWTVFLHPAQRELVERGYSGPARISGSAGTGKTVVALHRAAHLARAHPGARVLLTTFSDSLANALRAKLARLVGNEPRIAERVDVQALDAVAERLYARRVGPVDLARDALVRDLVRDLVREAAASGGRVAIGTMHLSKGLEFRAVSVMACDDEVLPQQSHVEAVTDATDLEEVYNTERHLLYVACTRARDHLLVTGVEPVSEFVQDMQA